MKNKKEEGMIKIIENNNENNENIYPEISKFDIKKEVNSMII